MLRERASMLPYTYIACIVASFKRQAFVWKGVINLQHCQQAIYKLNEHYNM
jgi:hypothetical protein